MREVAVILFNNFETLDVFGPIEVLGRLTEKFNPEFYSLDGGIIVSSQKVRVETRPLSELHSEIYILLIPGGLGVRDLLKNDHLVNKIAELSKAAEYIMTVCTGSILFSKTGLLDGRKATSNKRLFSWAQKESPNVRWIKRG